MWPVSKGKSETTAGFLVPIGDPSQMACMIQAARQQAELVENNERWKKAAQERLERQDELLRRQAEQLRLQEEFALRSARESAITTKMLQDLQTRLQNLEGTRSVTQPTSSSVPPSSSGEIDLARIVTEITYKAMNEHLAGSLGKEIVSYVTNQVRESICQQAHTIKSEIIAALRADADAPRTIAVEESLHVIMKELASCKARVDLVDTRVDGPTGLQHAFSRLQKEINVLKAMNGTKVEREQTLRQDHMFEVNKGIATLKAIERQITGKAEYMHGQLESRIAEMINERLGSTIEDMVREAVEKSATVK